jgi:hypothetical protein
MRLSRQQSPSKAGKRCFAATKRRCLLHPPVLKHRRSFPLTSCGNRHRSGERIYLPFTVADAWLGTQRVAYLLRGYRAEQRALVGAGALCIFSARENRKKPRPVGLAGAAWEKCVEAGETPTGQFQPRPQRVSISRRCLNGKNAAQVSPWQQSTRYP